MKLGIPALLLASTANAAPQIISADGRWATLQQGTTCEAASRSLLLAPKGKVQARASLTFEPSGDRRGQFAARLSRPVRAGSTVMLYVGDVPFLLVAKGDMAWSRGPDQEGAIIDAMRRSGGMRVEARSPGGGRIVDRYSLDGAPLAIDAAAACSARLAKR